MRRIDPTTPNDVEQLEDRLSRPSDGVVQSVSQWQGDLLILGVGGKMGPTLACMARRAFDAAGSPGRVIGVSRFSTPGLRERLADRGVETVACDLLDEAAVAELPDASQVIVMTGMKFGASSNAAMTWAMNCYMPSIYMRRFSQSRIAVFSSGNVYGLAAVKGGGSVETDRPEPVGEYAMTVLGRERMVEYFSRELATPVVLLRLNYAVELRYGVLVDLARRVFAGETIDLSMGYTNVIWQAEANAAALQAVSLATSPPAVINIAGPEILSVRDVCEQFGELFERSVEFTGQPAPDAFLNNAAHCHRLLGRPSVSADQMIRWTADWVARGGESLGKPTHFQNRDGKY